MKGREKEKDDFVESSSSDESNDEREAKPPSLPTKDQPHPESSKDDNFEPTYEKEIHPPFIHVQEPAPASKNGDEPSVSFKISLGSGLNSNSHRNDSPRSQPLMQGTPRLTPDSENSGLLIRPPAKEKTRWDRVLSFGKNNVSWIAENTLDYLQASFFSYLFFEFALWADLLPDTISYPHAGALFASLFPLSRVMRQSVKQLLACSHPFKDWQMIAFNALLALPRKGLPLAIIVGLGYGVGVLVDNFIGNTNPLLALNKGAIMLVVMGTSGYMGFRILDEKLGEKLWKRYCRWAQTLHSPANEPNPELSLWQKLLKLVYHNGCAIGGAELINVAVGYQGPVVYLSSFYGTDFIMRGLRQGQVYCPIKPLAIIDSDIESSEDDYSISSSDEELESSPAAERYQFWLTGILATIIMLIPAGLSFSMEEFTQAFISSSAFEKDEPLNRFFLWVILGLSVGTGFILSEAVSRYPLSACCTKMNKLYTDRALSSDEDNSHSSSPASTPYESNSGHSSTSEGRQADPQLPRYSKNS